MSNTAAVPHFPYGPRNIETELFRRALPMLAVFTPVAIVAGFFADEGSGVFSAVVGVTLGAANLCVAAVTLERAARIGPNMLMAATLGGFAVRLATLTAIFLVLTQLKAINMAVLGLVLVATHVGLLIAEATIISRADAAAGVDPGKFARSPIDGAGDSASREASKSDSETRE